MQHQQHPPQHAAGNMATSNQHTNAGCRPIPKFCRLPARHFLFKMAHGGLFVTLVLFLLGVFGPAWRSRDGLWTRCACPYPYCPHSFCGNSPYINAVRACEVLALLSLLACVCVALYQEVLKTPPPPDTKAVEILAGLAGVLGIAGVAVFGAWFEKYNWTMSSSVRSLGYVSWSAGVTGLASVLVLLCSVLIGCSRVRHASRTAAVMAARGIYILPAGVVYVPPAPAGQAACPNSQAGYPESRGTYPDTAETMQSGVHTGYPATPHNMQAGSYPGTPKQEMQGTCQPPASLDQGGIYPDLATYYATHLPPAALVNRPMTSQIATAPPASEIPVEGASTSSNPCSPTKRSTSIAPSSLPVCYVVNEGKTIPVYDQIPEVIVTAAP
ncbi:uncharacterized protein [Littorina saxatilis]|uniref:Transmembrane protein n=1 Tax=Littorina saxatilis TaxID=31220 RepID=A0AAN9GLP1_9CAEN